MSIKSAVLRSAAAGALIGGIAAMALASGAPEFGPAGIDPAAGNPAVAPGDDFYDHVNGKWLASTQIPADLPRWNMSRRLRAIAATRVHDILEEAARAPASDDERKFGDFYSTYMDETSIDAKGIAPIKAELAEVSRIATPRDLALAFAKFERTSPPFGFAGLGGDSDFPVTVGVTVDLDNPTDYEAVVGQGGLALPSLDYYTATDVASAAARTAYKSYITTLFTLVGMANAAERADGVIALESRVAATHWSAADERDIDKTHNSIMTAELAAAAPGFDWPLYLRKVGLSGQSRVIVAEPSALAGFAKLVSTVPMATWRDYVAVRVIGNAAPFLPKPFVDADFAFFKKALSGTAAPSPRWKRGVGFANDAMGDAIGRPYAQRWFPAASKTAMLAMVSGIEAAMAARINRLDWMAPATKVRAKAKLAALLIEVGYPDRWRDYSALKIVRGDAVGNVQRANAFEFNRQLSHLGNKVDRHEWDLLTTPQFADAFNFGPLIKLAFPAAFLAPPFFDPAADPAVNYGAIGAIIGHEITHSFDDQGAKLDENGRREHWWTASDEAAFMAATERLAAQYDGYEPLPGRHIDGHLTLGENTADLGGLLAALDAYHASLGGQPAPFINGLTGDQRFFISYAQSFRGLDRPEALRQMLASNPHAPDRYRVATVRNIDDWYTAFDVTPEQKMALEPAERVRIW